MESTVLDQGGKNFKRRAKKPEETRTLSKRFKHG